MSKSDQTESDRIRQRPKVLVVDDDSGVRQSLQQLVETMDLEAVCFESAESFLAALDHSWHGCVVLDIRMPGMGGMELHQRLVDEGCEIPEIIMTGHGDIPTSVAAMKRGAVNFLEKPYRPAELRASISAAIVADVRRICELEASSRMAARFANLTSEEYAVMGGIVAGKTNAIIANEIDVSLRTVQFRRASLMDKLSVTSKAELVELVDYAHRNESGRRR